MNWTPELALLPIAPHLHFFTTENLTSGRHPDLKILKNYKEIYLNEIKYIKLKTCVLVKSKKKYM